MSKKLEDFFLPISHLYNFESFTYDEDGFDIVIILDTVVLQIHFPDYVPCYRRSRYNIEKAISFYQGAYFFKLKNSPYLEELQDASCSFFTPEWYDHYVLLTNPYRIDIIQKKESNEVSINKIV